MLDTHCLIYIVDLLVTIHISLSWVGWEHVSTDDDDELRAIIIFIHSSIIWEWIEIDMLLQNEPLALPFYFLFSLISLGSKTASLVITMTNYLWDPHILCFIGSFLRIPQGQQDDLVRKPQLFNCRFLYCIFLYLSWNAFKSIFREGAPSHQAHHHHQVFSPRFEPGRLHQLHQVDQEDVRKQYLGRFSRDQVDFFANCILYPLDDIGWYPLDIVQRRQRNLMFDRWPTPMLLNPWGCKGQGLRPAFKVTILQAPFLNENNGLPQPCWRGSATLQSCATLSLAKKIFFHLTKLTKWLANKTLPPNMRLGLGTKGNKDQGLREAQTQGLRTKIQEAEVRTKRSSKRPGLAVDQLCGGNQTIFCLRLYLTPYLAT